MFSFIVFFWKRNIDSNKIIQEYFNHLFCRPLANEKQYLFPTFFLFIPISGYKSWKGTTKKNNETFCSRPNGSSIVSLIRPIALSGRGNRKPSDGIHLSSGMKTASNWTNYTSFCVPLPVAWPLVSHLDKNLHIANGFRIACCRKCILN